MQKNRKAERKAQKTSSPTAVGRHLAEERKEVTNAGKVRPGMHPSPGRWYDSRRGHRSALEGRETEQCLEGRTIYDRQKWLRERWFVSVILENDTVHETDLVTY